MNYTVTQVNNYIKNMFEKDCILNNIYVRGEISNCKYHTSGHIYFTLKDEYGQIAGVMFAGMRKGLTFRLEEGQSVIIYGNVSIYERDGKYQLYAREITLDGLGVLYLKFEELKKILQLQGLFDEEHKKPIPKYASKIGVVTARTGAALQDILNIVRRRNPYVEIVLAPALVQGEGAAESIVKAIKMLDNMGLDVLIVGRGGGSIEDLWAFNEEIVARAVYECNTPVISAVGHETDTTIIDYVSDLRAPTPSAAAELATFDYNNFQQLLNEYTNSLNNRMEMHLNRVKYIYDNLKLKLQHAGPAYKMMQYRQYLTELQDRLSVKIEEVVVRKRHTLDIYIEKLMGLSPLSRLKSGYVLVTNEEQKVINTVGDVSKEDKIKLSFVDGDVVATVDDVVKVKRSAN